ncbi:MAG TPA: Fic family protein [Chthonomonadaceae bacterium]|nr:Fic family protein [Chthonomonadaceae bacterium]
MLQKSGTYVRSIEGYRTYIPAALPPNLTRLSPETEEKIEEATFLMGQVKMCRRLLPNANLLIYSSLQREALASSTIEGTIATPEQLVLFQLSQQSDRSEVGEVANYGEALRTGVAQIADRDLTVGFIRSLHQILLTGVRGQQAAGQLKTRQNAIGNPTDTVDSAAFVPCPPERVAELMEALEQYLTGHNREPKVVQCGLAHHQFETIHPFSDGNGRIGRLLIVLHLIKLGLLDAPLIYPSVYFERTRKQYYASLQGVRETGIWDDWLAYFAEALIESCGSTIAFTEALRSLQDELHARVSDIRARASVVQVLNSLFEEPFQSVRQVADRLNITPKTALNALETLCSHHIAVEVSGRTWKRVYACSAVLNLVFGIDFKVPTE